MGIKDVIKCLDFLGPNPTMYIKGKQTYQSTFGGLLSLVCIILLSIAFGYFFYLLFSRTNFSVMMNQEINLNPLVNWTNQEITVSLLDKTGREIPNSDRLFRITADFWWNKPRVENGNVTSYLIENFPIKLEKCNYTEHFSNKELWKDNPIFSTTAAVCLARNQSLIVQKTFGSENYTGIVFWIHKCQNSTGEEKCLGNEEIDKTLENVWVKIGFLDYYYDNNNFTNPAVPFINLIGYQASTSVYKRLWLLFENVEYYQDDGLLLPYSVKWMFSNFLMKEESTDLRKGATVAGTFCTISINNHHLLRKYFRRYYKAQNMLADFGGLVKGLLLLSTIINYFPVQRMYLRKVVNRNLKNIQQGAMHCKENQEIIREKINYILLPKAQESKIQIYNPQSMMVNSSFHKNIDEKNMTNLGNFSGLAFNNHQYKNQKLNNNKNIRIKTTKLTCRSIEKIHLSCSQIFCFKSFFNNRKKQSSLSTFNLYKIISKTQLDIRNVLDQLNMTDKLTFLLAGAKYENIIRNLRNPYIVLTKTNSEAYHKRTGIDIATPPIALSSEFIGNNWIELVELSQIADGVI